MQSSRECLSVFLETYRQQNQLSKKQLADKLDIEVNYLGKLRRCNVNVTCNYIDGILAKLNLTADQYISIINQQQTAEA